MSGLNKDLLTQFGADQGIAPPAPSKPSANAQPDTPPRSALKRAPKAPSQRPTAKVRTKRTGKKNTTHRVPDSNKSKPSTITLDETQHRKFIEVRDELEISSGALIVEALTATLDDLPELLQKMRTPDNPAGFTIGGISSPTKAEQAPKALLPFRLPSSDFNLLDDLVANLGATNRTHLIRTALQAYFEMRETSD